MTISLEMNKSSTMAIYRIIDGVLKKTSIESLKSDPGAYVVASNLMEIRQKLMKRVDDYRIFGGEDEWKLKLTRAQALAFDCWFHPSNEDEQMQALIKNNAYEYGLVTKICGIINQKFYA